MRSTSSFPTTGSPNDPWFTSQGNLTTTGITNVWKYFTTGDSTIIVAVIDSGAQWDHEDLVGNKWISTTYPNGGYDYMDTDNDPFPADSALHGTNVAGVISARTHNSIGLSGVAGGVQNKRGVQIMHLRAGKKGIPSGGGGGSGGGCDEELDPGCIYAPTSGGSPDEYLIDYILNALTFAVNNGANVINMSFGSLNVNTAFKNQIEDIRDNHPNIIMVAAVGNDDGDEILYPARYDGVFAVGALNTAFTARWLDPIYSEFGSNYGDQIDFVAPGQYISTTTLFDTYTNQISGTSMATPLVSGVVALMLSVNPNLSRSSAHYILKQTADRLGTPEQSDGWNQYFGYGKVNAFKAVDMAQLHTPTITSITGTTFGVPRIEWTPGYLVDAPNYTVYRGPHDPAYYPYMTGMDAIATVNQNWYEDWETMVDEYLGTDVYYVVRVNGWSGIQSGNSNAVSIKANAPLKVKPGSESTLPEKVGIKLAYPNPFNPSTQLGVELPESSHVRIEIFDVMGRRVTTVHDQVLSSGSHSLQWNVGSGLASGVYIAQYRITGLASGYPIVFHQKLNLLK